MREREIQGKVVGYARGRLVICRKLDFGDGWPDYMLLFDGRLLFIEFKGAGGRLRPLQLYVHNLLRAGGFTVEVVDDVESGKAIVDAFVGNSVVDYSSVTKELCK